MRFGLRIGETPFSEILRIGPFPIRFDDPGLFASGIDIGTFRPTGKKVAELAAGTIVLAGWGVVTADWEGPDGPDVLVLVGPPAVPETPQFVHVGSTPLVPPDGSTDSDYFIGLNAVGSPVFAAGLGMLAIANEPAGLYAQVYTIGDDAAALTAGEADIYALVMASPE